MDKGSCRMEGGREGGKKRGNVGWKEGVRIGKGKWFSK